MRHAIEAFNANQESFLNNDKIDSYDNCTIAFFHWALHRREMPSAEGFEREEEAYVRQSAAISIECKSADVIVYS